MLSKVEPASKKLKKRMEAHENKKMPLLVPKEFLTTMNDIKLVESYTRIAKKMHGESWSIR